jgi:hypothetical protein
VSLEAQAPSTASSYRCMTSTAWAARDRAWYAARRVHGTRAQLPRDPAHGVIGDLTRRGARVCKNIHIALKEIAACQQNALCCISGSTHLRAARDGLGPGAMHILFHVSRSRGLLLRDSFGFRRLEIGSLITFVGFVFLGLLFSLARARRGSRAVGFKDACVATYLSVNGCKESTQLSATHMELGSRRDDSAPRRAAQPVRWRDLLARTRSFRYALALAARGGDICPVLREASQA